MADTRRGLNCTLSYSDGRTLHAYRIRAGRIMHEFEMIAEESQGRRFRAYYPKMTAPTQFGVQALFIGKRERDSFNSYMMRYAEYALDPGLQGRDFPQMTVEVPKRRFTRIGIPLMGVEFGDHLGAMVFSPMLVFATSGEPLDWDQGFRISRVYNDRAASNSPAAEYFYPTGTQLSGGAAPLDPEGLTTLVQAAVNGAAAVVDAADRAQDAVN